MKILVVDDEQDICEILQFNLEMEGYEVTTANSAEEVLELPLSSFDIILLDVMMPVMDGLEAAHQIRTCGHPDSATVPMIAVSANAFDEDRRAAKDCGMNGFISKPINMQEVIQALRDNL